jgi:putative protease
LTSAAGTIELLAPAGEPRALRAALAAGADAVYFGLDRWSARAFAGNFAGETVVKAVELAHLYDVGAYLALNTLLKDAEVEPALAALEAPYAAGLDALIVADLGFAARVRETYPELPLHASTQLNTHSSSQLEALARLGFSRAVLARELSLGEIAALDAHGLELEAFVHGALCYGYSGDCLLSSMVGGRSGNRGRCSQACRLRYSLRRLGEHPEPGERAEGGAAGREDEAEDLARVMSTSDLAAIAVLPRLLEAGITSFKLEGRMKDAAYVGVTTAVYRDALDAALADPGHYRVRPEWNERLEQSFSRSFTTAHLEGRHAEVRSGGRGGHRGVLVGRVTRVNEARGEVAVRLRQPVAAGDLVYLYTPWGQTEPARLEESADEEITLRLRERVAVKDRLFRLAAADAGQLARDLVAGRQTRRPILLRLCLVGEVGRPAALAVEQLDGGPSVTVTTAESLAAARTAALTADKARDALGALGGTPYRIGDLEFAVDDGVFLGVGDLKDLRRRALAALDEARLEARRRTPAEPPAPASMQAGGRGGSSGAPAPAARPRALAMAPPAAGHVSVILVLRPGERPLRGAEAEAEAFCLDLQTGDDPAAVAAGARELRRSGLRVYARTPEVLFDTDTSWLDAVLAQPWAGVYVRHLGALRELARRPNDGETAVFLEYPLQGLNALTSGAVTGLAGRSPHAVVTSPEASLEEIIALRAALTGAASPGSPPEIHVLAFGRQQVLHSRDQLGRAEGLYEAPGPASHVGLLLEDAKGYVFPADVDAGGTRLFNARVTNLAPNLDDLVAAGVTGFLVVQSDLDERERAAFAADGLAALASLATRERSTTGHLFRGVA